MKANGILALLTDFGTTDWYVASMKATAISANPSISLVDITHEVTPGSIPEGAFVLNRCYNDFPNGTTFLVVVDPGVGTAREAMIVKAGDYYFVGPNNGVLFPVVCQFDEIEAVQIEHPDWLGAKSSNTFHGRDVFAPAASRLAGGASFRDAGNPIDKLTSFKFPIPSNQNGKPIGQIIYFDRYGNGLTNLLPSHLDAEELVGLRVSDTLFPVANTFGEVDEGTPVSYWGSSGFIEVAVRNQSAQLGFDLTTGDTVIPVYKATKGLLS